MKPYSEDLRTRIARAIQEGMSNSAAARLVEGATDREVFEAYVEEMLAPSLRSGQIVVMDNLSAHKGDRIRELIEERGCELLYLLPYSPDLSPHRGSLQQDKKYPALSGGQSREALIEAMGRAPEAITSQDAEGFFRHCGYRSPSQLL